MTPEQQRALAKAAARRRREQEQGSIQQPASVDANEDGFSSLEMAKNVPGSAWNVVKDMASAVGSPIDTAKALGNVALGAVSKLIPGEQESEAYADAVGRAMVERYGSIDSALETLEQDPVGAFLDVASFASGAGVITKGGKLAQMSKARPPKASGPLSQSAYRSAAKFTTATDDPSKAASTALKQRVMPTHGGEKRVAQLKADLGKQYDPILNKIDTQFDVDTLFRDMGRLRETLDPEDAQKLDKLIKKRREAYTKEGVDKLTAKELHDAKKLADDKARWARRSGKPTVQEEFNTNIANVARAELERVAPEIKSLNQKYGELLELEKSIEQPARRIANRDILGLGGIGRMGVGGGAGYATGDPLVGALVGGGLMALDSPTFKAQSAIRGRQLANVLRAYSPASGTEAAILGAQGSRVNQNPEIQALRGR